MAPPPRPPNRKRPAVTLTLDADVLTATRQLLKRVPNEPVTISALVEDLLRGFVTEVGPMIEIAESTDDPIQRVRSLEALFGRQVVRLSGEFSSTVRATQEAKKGD